MLLVGLLVVPMALAQTNTPSRPVQGAYDEVYVVTGRVIDSEGMPAAGAKLLVHLEQRGIRALPLEALANCYGDYITSFNLRDVQPDGKVTVSLQEGQPAAGAKASAKLDSFYRRTDVDIQLPARWDGECPDMGDTWIGRVSIAGRVVQRTEPFEVDGITFHAEPYYGAVDMLYHDPSGQMHCPPTGAPGECERLATDERGDFRYSFTFPGHKDAEGRIELRVDGRHWNATVDPEFRIARFHVDATGQGPPVMPRESSGLPLLALLGVLVLVGAARSVLLRRQ